MRKIIVFLSIYILICYSSFAQSDTTIIYKELGLSFTCPKNWYVDTAFINSENNDAYSISKKHYRVTLSPPDSNSYAFLTIEIKEYNLTKSFYEFMKNQKVSYEEDQLTFYNMRKLKTNELEAYEVYSNWHKHQQPGEAKMWYVLDNDSKVTKITFETAPYKLKNFEKSVSKIFNSIKIF